MNDSPNLDRATSHFLYHLSTQNGDWKQSAWGNVNISVSNVQISASPKNPFDDERARQVAESWGFELLGRKKISGRYYWKVRRTDAPPADIIGGPRRDLVRANPKAQEEAKHVLQETGIDLLDPDESKRIEEEASKYRASAVKGTWEVSCLGSLTILFGAFGILLLFVTLAVAIPLLVFGTASLYGVIRSAISAKRNSKEYKTKHLKNIEAIRRVVRVAEDELRAGWRPSELPN